MLSMFRLIPHRALVEPEAEVVETRDEGGSTAATLRVGGLLCSACAANVRGRLERVDGVRSAQVDLERGEAHVTYDSGRAAPDDLIDAVEGAVVLRPARKVLARLSRPLTTRTSH